eukprot:364860-Chlamydomonas_euryale.AAC.8
MISKPRPSGDLDDCDRPSCMARDTISYVLHVDGLMMVSSSFVVQGRPLHPSMAYQRPEAVDASAWWWDV